jgi:hypothetical protein
MPEKNNKLYYLIVLSAIGILGILILLYILPADEFPDPYIIWGSLTYNPDSKPINGTVTFKIDHLGGNYYRSDIQVHFLNGTNILSNYSISWRYNLSDSQYIRNGDEITIEMPNTDMRGDEVIISVTGYSGTISGIVPKN